MRRTNLGGAAALWLAMGAGAWAQDAEKPDAEGVAAVAAPAADDAVGQFDADGDGQLLGDELRRARGFVQALRGAIGDRGRETGPPREGDRGRPDRQRDGRGGRGGPPQLDEGRRAGAEGDRPGPATERDGTGPAARPSGPQPQQTARLFREFDDNEDGQLNREEFTALMGAFRERLGAAGRGGPQVPPEGQRQFRDAEGPPRARRGGDGFGPPRGIGRPPREAGDRGFDSPSGPPEAAGEGPARPDGPPRGPRRVRDGGRRPPRDSGFDAEVTPAPEAAATAPDGV